MNVVLRGLVSKNGNSSTDPNFSNLPRHVAIIMDGNGRWAKRRFLPRVEGHRSGAKTVRMVVEESRRLGVRYLTLYTFSTENWNRPKDEVSALMRLFDQYLKSEVKLMLDNNIRLRSIGNRDRLPDFVRGALEDGESKTAHCTGMDLILAVSYGAREELVRACKLLAEDVSKGNLSLDAVTERSISERLYAPDVPDPDLLIRTSDENRISNFLLWQLAYSEIVVSSLLWPEFSKEEYHRCLVEYGKRERRVGLTEAQLSQEGSLESKAV